VRFELARESETDLAVYDVSGHLVKRLLHDHLPAGSHMTVWDGTDLNGRRVPSGVRFAPRRLRPSLPA
jgi:flagellar hook assembly protein FlgD